MDRLQLTDRSANATLGADPTAHGGLPGLCHQVIALATADLRQAVAIKIKEFDLLWRKRGQFYDNILIDQTVGSLAKPGERPILYPIFAAFGDFEIGEYIFKPNLGEDVRIILLVLPGLKGSRLLDYMGSVLGAHGGFQLGKP